MKYYGMTDWARRRDSERMEHVGFREIEINDRITMNLIIQMKLMHTKKYLIMCVVVVVVVLVVASCGFLIDCMHTNTS
jgi:hypothetical protein